MIDAYALKMTGPVRVFLLDDHEIVRRGVADVLNTEPDIEVVGEHGSATGESRHSKHAHQTLRCSTYVWVTAAASRCVVIFGPPIPMWPV